MKVKAKVCNGLALDPRTIVYFRSGDILSVGYKGLSDSDLEHLVNIGFADIYTPREDVLIPEEDNSEEDNSEKDNSEEDNSEEDNSEKDNSEEDNSEEDNSEEDNSEEDNSEEDNSEEDNSEEDNSDKPAYYEFTDKNEFEEYAKEIYGVDLDKRKSISGMIKQLEESLEEKQNDE